MIHQHRCTFLPPRSTQCAGCKFIPHSSVAMPEDEIASGSAEYMPRCIIPHWTKIDAFRLQRHEIRQSLPITSCPLLHKVDCCVRLYSQWLQIELCCPIILYFATHLRNKILYGPYLQFNGPTTLPYGARLLSTALPSAQSELQGKKQQGNDHVPLIWLLYHLLFSKRTSKNKSFISKLSPDISWLAWLCPHWYQRAPKCV